MQKTQILVILTAVAVLVVGIAMIAGYGIHKPQTDKGDVPLVNTYWKLMTIDGKLIEMSEDMEREPHFVLHTDENRLAGFSGCNRMSGTYKVDGDTISFAPGVAMTRMACPDAADIESAFTQVIEKADGWKITEDDLVLSDKDGKVLAEFEQRLME
jgi:heat shock protein HslJ